MTNLPNPFDSGIDAPLPDEAAVRSGLHASRTAADIPADKERYPFGCPDPEWCRGISCYWHCNEPDDMSNIAEIFVGYRKLFDPDPAAYTSADQAYYDLLKQMDDPHTADLIEMPYGMEGLFDPPPLFLRAAGF